MHIYTKYTHTCVVKLISNVYTPYTQPSDSESLVLMVSYKQKPFRQARFPQSSEGQRLTEKVYVHTYL